MVDGSKDKNNQKTNLNPSIFKIKVALLILSSFVTVSIGLYFLKFNGGLSPDSKDWAHFGSYVGGVVTLPVTVMTLFLVYRNYNLQKGTYNETITRNLENSMLVALNLCIDDVESGFKFVYMESDRGTITYADVFCVPELFARLKKEVLSDKEEQLIVTMRIGKKLVSLYELLKGYEDKFGRTDVVKSIKFRYMSYYALISSDIPNIVRINGNTAEVMNKFFSETER